MLVSPGLALSIHVVRWWWWEAGKNYGTWTRAKVRGIGPDR